MRPRRFSLTSGDKVVPIDHRSDGECAVHCTGGGNYTCQYTLDNVYDDSITPAWVDITDMAATTSAVTKSISDGATAIKTTHNSGGSITVTISQR